ncbi:MAG: heparinase II/III family protein [Rhodobacteraceae bacterium]|nr:heparinase II/III family protein [Paracoccaceae bacterium]
MLDGWTAGRARLLDRLAAWRAGLVAAEARFAAPPEPWLIGDAGRGRDLLDGHLAFGGARAEARGRSPWAVRPPGPAFSAELHGFAWLDDLAALGTPAAASLACAWVGDWTRRYGRGGGPGWTAGLAGRRLLRLVAHGILLTAREAAGAGAVRRQIARHMAFLAQRGADAPGGLARIEALTAMLLAAQAVEDGAARATAAEAALGRAAAAAIARDGTVPSRNPEELLRLFELLAVAAGRIAATGRAPVAPLLAAIEAAAPVLRALRHTDGGLARFHGGGRGAEGALDRALAFAGLRPALPPAAAMGYVRLAAGRTSVIVDAASPPAGSAGEGHASTLAFELTSARRPVIVSCGAGAPFGPEWQQAGRATAAHSTLAIEGHSSSRPGRDGRLATAAPARQIELPGERGSGALRLLAAHEGYLASHGLTHTRRLELGPDGRSLAGEDALGAVSRADQRRLARVVREGGGDGVHFTLHFHLHPDAAAELDPGGQMAWIGLRSGEVWVFRQDGMARLSLEPSLWLERGAPAPAATRQIVLAAVLIDYQGRVGWSLAKAPGTPLALRDVGTDDEAPAEDKG